MRPNHLPSCPGREKPAAHSRAPCPAPVLASVDPDELSRGNLEVGFRPQKSEKAESEPRPEAGEDGQQVGDREPARRASDSEEVAQLPRPEEGGPAEIQTCSPGWSSAFYEASCFGADVHSYVEELGLCRAGGTPDTASPVSAGPPPTAVGSGEQGPRSHRHSRSLR